MNLEKFSIRTLNLSFNWIAWIFSLCLCVYRCALGVKKKIFSVDEIESERRNNRQREQSSVENMGKSGKNDCRFAIAQVAHCWYGYAMRKKHTHTHRERHTTWHEMKMCAVLFMRREKKTILSYIHYNTPVLTMCVCAFVSLSIGIYTAWSAWIF